MPLVAPGRRLGSGDWRGHPGGFPGVSRTQLGCLPPRLPSISVGRVDSATIQTTGARPAGRSRTSSRVGRLRRDRRSAAPAGGAIDRARASRPHELRGGGGVATLPPKTRRRSRGEAVTRGRATRRKHAARLQRGDGRREARQGRRARRCPLGSILGAVVDVEQDGIPGRCAGSDEVADVASRGW